jgi:prolyl oligopeptidase
LSTSRGDNKPFGQLSGMRKHLSLVVLIFFVSIAQWHLTQDPFLWLEEVDGERALAWVKERNQATSEKYESRSDFKSIYQRSLAILDSKEKIVYPSVVGPNVYNFWRDEEHERGILRRLPSDRFLSGDKNWETVLDIDALSEAEGENWVYHGHLPLAPDYRRTLVWLSPGGSDASVVREFDLAEKTFVESGFELPEAKSRVAWRDENSLYVATDFGPDSMTNSGYPRILKVWQRGTPLSQARTLMTVAKEDVAVAASVFRGPEGQHDFVVCSTDFWNAETFLVKKGKLRKLPIPTDAVKSAVFRGQLLLRLRSDWKVRKDTFPAGTLLSLDIKALRRGKVRPKVLHNPKETAGFIKGVQATADHVVVTLSHNVKTRLYLYRFNRGNWSSEPVDAPSVGVNSALGCSPYRNDFFFTHDDWLSPTTLSYCQNNVARELQKLPATFSSEGLVSEQHWATSADGTRVPYYIIRPRNLEYNGTAPTLLWGYGGFEVSILPFYPSVLGPAWLERGGVYVSANIRGGGEFGPAWHQAALRENRPRAFEDFEAVAEDLIAKGVTSPDHLGISGSSNGGLLTGATLTRRPDLYGAALIGVPLLDMKRYHKLLAGASWMGEYGDPDDPADWAFLKTYSPYHNIKPDGDYPVPLIHTSTKDDRVHPGHARKMTARMMSHGHEVEYYENIEGGHAGSSNNAQRAYFAALSYSYLWDRLKVTER